MSTHHSHDHSAASRLERSGHAHGMRHRTVGRGGDADATDRLYCDADGPAAADATQFTSRESDALIVVRDDCLCCSHGSSGRVHTYRHACSEAQIRCGSCSRANYDGAAEQGAGCEERKCEE